MSVISDYPFPKLTNLLTLKCTVKQYIEVVSPYVTQDKDLRPLNIGDDYWNILPNSIVMCCPICTKKQVAPIDVYSLIGWLGFFGNELSKEFYRTQRNAAQSQEKFCPHFLGVHQFLNLHGTLPSELNYLTGSSGEVPLVTYWCLPDDIASYAVLHALPICRIEGNAFIPRYTVFSLAYFNLEPSKVRLRHYKGEFERGQGDREFYPSGLSMPTEDPAADQAYDLKYWASQGRLGYLDFTQPDLPLQIGANLRLPDVYRQIEGKRLAFTWRDGKLTYQDFYP